MPAIHFISASRARYRHRAAAPVARGKQQKQRAEDDLSPGDGVGGRTVGGGVGLVGGDVRDAADEREGDDPAELNRSQLTRARRGNSISVREMIGAGLSATPTA